MCLVLYVYRIIYIPLKNNNLYAGDCFKLFKTFYNKPPSMSGFCTYTFLLNRLTVVSPEIQYCRRDIWTQSMGYNYGHCNDFYSVINQNASHRHFFITESNSGREESRFLDRWTLPIFVQLGMILGISERGGAGLNNRRIVSLRVCIHTPPRTCYILWYWYIVLFLLIYIAYYTQYTRAFCQAGHASLKRSYCFRFEL